MSIWEQLGASAGSAVLGSLLSPQAPTVPQLPNMGQAAGNVFGDINSLNNPSSTLQPLELQQLMAALNNPNLSGYLDSSKNAGAASTAMGGADINAGNMLTGAAGQLYQTGFDPQNELYNRMLQQNRDQSNVTNSMYGLGGSGAGAGIAGANLNNFNIDWQNQQLQRQLAATGGMGGALRGANDLYGAGVNAYQQGGAIPYNAYNNAVGNANTALGTYADQQNANNQFDQTAIGDWLSYLTGGNQAAGVNQNAFTQQQGANANTAAGLYPFLYAGAQGLGGGGGGATAAPNPYADPFSTNPNLGSSLYDSGFGTSSPVGPAANYGNTIYDPSLTSWK